MITKKEVEEEFKVKLRDLLTKYKAILSIDGGNIIGCELFIPKLGLGKVVFKLGEIADKNLKV